MMVEVKTKGAESGLVAWLAWQEKKGKERHVWCSKLCTNSWPEDPSASETGLWSLIAVVGEEQTQCLTLEILKLQPPPNSQLLWVLFMLMSGNWPGKNEYRESELDTP